jgi:hypothetical protein
MRQVYRLLGLARRYSDGRVEAACAQALAIDVVDVGLITRLLERGREHASAPVAEQLPLRFARHDLSTREHPHRPPPDTAPAPLRPSEPIVGADVAGDAVVGERR